MKSELISAVELADRDAKDLTARGCSEVRDVEVPVRAECHTCREGQSGGYIFDIASAVEAYNLPDAEWWGGKTGSIVEFECVEETIRAKVDGNDCSEAGARSREPKLLRLVVAAETKEEGPRACADVEAHDFA